MRGSLLFSAMVLVGCGSSVAVDSEGSGGGVASPGDGGSDPSGTGGTGGGAGVCADRFATVLELDVTTNPVLGGPGVGIDVSSACRVDAVTTEGFTLSCQDADLGAFTLSASVAGTPADLPLPIAVDDDLLLDLEDLPSGHHQQPTTFLALQDAATEELRWLGVSFSGGITSRPDRLAELGERLDDLQLAVDETACAPVECGDGQQRLGIRVRDGDGNTETVMDADRAPVTLSGVDFDLWVGTARSSECVNVVDTYHFVLTARP